MDDLLLAIACFCFGVASGVGVYVWLAQREKLGVSSDVVDLGTFEDPGYEWRLANIVHWTKDGGLTHTVECVNHDGYSGPSSECPACSRTVH